MASSEKPRASAEAVPPDLLPLIRAAGILPERLFDEIRSKVRAGDYPLDALELARLLVKQGTLTEYQARKLLTGKTAGMTIGKYILLDRLGSGAMGRVYRAQHALMGRVVALKVIAPEIAANARVISRFQREMRMVGRLDHPNVVRAFDADKLANLLYLVMEYVPGMSLGQRLKTQGVLTPAEAAEFGGQAALGLAHAHEQGIVHRDVKPSNLLLSVENQIKVLDLGLGVLTEADHHTSFATADGIAVGTIDYMSPEQASGKELDGRSDLFSLGCTLYHLVSGRLPYPGQTPIDRLGKRLSGRPTPILEHRADVPPKLVRVLEKLMASSLRDRYQTATEASEALFGLVRRKTVAAARPLIVADPAAEEAQPSAMPAPPLPEPEVITVEPEYPGWFRPLGRLAEHQPALALLATLATLAVAMGAGVAVGALLL